MQARPTAPEAPTGDDAATLTISPEKACFIILKAREFDAKDAVTEPNPASNPSDDRDAAVLEDHSDDPVVEELTSLIDSLSEDEQIDLVALTWLGRDDYFGQRLASGPGGGSACAQQSHRQLPSWHAPSRRFPGGRAVHARLLLRRI